MKRHVRGFTLVEILIVVIILGILAAIVIPQFSNASSDARNNSVSSTLQTLRSQIELFKVQHVDNYPQTTAIGTNFALMLTVSTMGDTSVTTGGTGANLGPYMQQAPINPLNKNTGVSAVATSTLDGWYYSATPTAYTLFPRGTDGESITTY